MSNYRIGSLFSGIGGLELGLERAGLGRVVWQVEQDNYCRQVLAKHWPDAVRFEDVRSAGAGGLEPVDLICGGFPCQDLSVAGSGEGLDGDRSGLWFEYARIIRELLPRFVVVENVPALTFRGLDRVLGSLAGLGYSARWGVLSAQDVGAPHLRRRLFIVAWREMADASNKHAQQHRKPGAVGRAARAAREQGVQRQRLRAESLHRGPALANADRPEAATKPGVGRGVDGLPAWMDHAWPAGRGPEQHPGEPPRIRKRRPGDRQRLKALGNAVVPQCAYVIGLELLRMERSGWI